MPRPHVDRNDAIQDGINDLGRTVAGFDWRKGDNFSSFATWWIPESMHRGLENTGARIRRRVLHALTSFRPASEALAA